MLPPEIMNRKELKSIGWNRIIKQIRITGGLRMRCEFCGEEITKYTNESYNYNGNELNFCKACWKQYMNLGSMYFDEKKKAISFFRKKEAQDSMSPAGREFIMPIIRQTSLELTGKPLPDSSAEPNQQTEHEPGGHANNTGLTIFHLFGSLFMVAAVIFYIISIQEVSSGYNTIRIANIQSTIFAATCFIAGVINFTAALIIKRIHKE